MNRPLTRVESENLSYIAEAVVVGSSASGWPDFCQRSVFTRFPQEHNGPVRGKGIKVVKDPFTVGTSLLYVRQRDWPHREQSQLLYVPVTVVK